MRNIPIPELSSVWPEVRKFLSLATTRFGERVTPEELYHALRTNMASLYLDEDGCIVAQKLTELDGTTTLFALLAAGKLAEKQEECQALLERLAGVIGASRIRMASPRKGWERVGYWTVAHVVYEHDLRNGNVQVAA